LTALRLYPRAALRQAAGVPGPVRDPRLSPAGNRLARQLGLLLELLSRLENWQRHPPTVEINLGTTRISTLMQYRLMVGAALALDVIWKRYHDKRLSQ
jgi:hypothetical protein